MRMAAGSSIIDRHGHRRVSQGRRGGSGRQVASAERDHFSVSEANRVRAWLANWATSLSCLIFLAFGEQSSIVRLATADACLRDSGVVDVQVLRAGSAGRWAGRDVAAQPGVASTGGLLMRGRLLSYGDGPDGYALVPIGINVAVSASGTRHVQRDAGWSCAVRAIAESRPKDGRRSWPREHMHPAPGVACHGDRCSADDGGPKR
jgi:hypothetical protein